MVVIFFTERTWLVIFVVLCSGPVGASAAPVSLTSHSTLTGRVTRCGLVSLPFLFSPPFSPSRVCPAGGHLGEGRGRKTRHMASLDLPMRYVNLQAFRPLRESVTLYIAFSSVPTLFLSPSCPPLGHLLLLQPPPLPRGSSSPSPAPLPPSGTSGKRYVTGVRLEMRRGAASWTSHL